jgi:hypothetical protein
LKERSKPDPPVDDAGEATMADLLGAISGELVDPRTHGTRNPLNLRERPVTQTIQRPDPLWAFSDGDSIPGGQKSIFGELRSSGGTQEPNHEDP